LRDIHKTYENQPLLNGISFRVAEGETVCLLGASGSGKSTILRIIAGLEFPDRGRVFWNGNDLREVPAHRRNFGLVFQDYALFPHLNVAENVAFGLKMAGLSRVDIKVRVVKALQQVGLGGFESRQVVNLSGGEQQRVALARALAPRPRMLMFDEPLGALDRSLRDQLLVELRNILHATGIPAIYVTHDQEEAFSVADRIALLQNGAIVQQGSPETVHMHPNSAWAADFLGLGTVIDGKALGEGRFETRLGIVNAVGKTEADPGEVVTLLIRPEKVILGGKGSQLSGRVADVQFQKDGYRVILDSMLYFVSLQEVQIGQVVSFNAEAEILA
jgi:ABC-type Fe3+/spermidine/putrescine transport system ATPase subunit